MTAVERSAFEVMVVGSGTIANVAALVCARSFSTVWVSRPESPNSGVESVPAALLTALLEFGIHPVELGVHALHTTRRVAWQSPVASVRAARAAAHVDRGRLSAALAARAAREPRLVRLPARESKVDWWHGQWRAGDLRARLLLDATGRRALEKGALVEPPKRWLGTVFSGKRGRADPSLWLTALPEGYAYRLGSDERISVGLVSFDAAPRTFDELQERLLRAGVSWLLDQIESDLGERQVRLASVAWPATAARPGLLRLGDAALARDALASQGLSLGISDAFHAARVVRSGQRSPLDARQLEAKQRHLGTLSELVDSSCHAASEPLAAYGSWLDSMTTALHAAGSRASSVSNHGESHGE